MSNFINDEIIIDFPVPASFQRVMDRMEQYDAEDDYGMYNAVCEPFHVDCKNACANGTITKKQWELLEMRYQL